MKIHVYSIVSSLHDENALALAESDFLSRIADAAGFEFEFHGSNFDDYDAKRKNIVFIRTGGTEGKFKSLNLKGSVTLLSSGFDNSLAASMEILAYLRNRGQDGVILHGTPKKIAHDILKEDSSKETSYEFIRPLTRVDLEHVRAAVIGHPSDWLIASSLDYEKARELLGLEIIDIPMSELLVRLKSFKGDMASFDGSLAIYSALKDIVREFSLSGLTIRCFDLLDMVHNTGCLALAKLNAEGISAGCEGDVPTLVSMMIAKQKTGSPSFQCNLSQVENDELLFAHCTVPLNMVQQYCYDTHFESGIGTAICGKFALEEVMIYKVSPSLEAEVAIPAIITDTPSKPNLCRTQIVVRAPKASKYFLNNPFANHHIVTKPF